MPLIDTYSNQELQIPDNWKLPGRNLQETAAEIFAVMVFDPAKFPDQDQQSDQQIDKLQFKDYQEIVDQRQRSHFAKNLLAI